jgi:hypothetical protein
MLSKINTKLFSKFLLVPAFSPHEWQPVASKIKDRIPSAEVSVLDTDQLPQNLSKNSHIITASLEKALEIRRFLNESEIELSTFTVFNPITLEKSSPRLNFIKSFFTSQQQLLISRLFESSETHIPLWLTESEYFQKLSLNVSVIRSPSFESSIAEILNLSPKLTPTSHPFDTDEEDDILFRGMSPLNFPKNTSECPLLDKYTETTAPRNVKFVLSSDFQQKADVKELNLVKSLSKGIAEIHKIPGRLLSHFEYPSVAAEIILNQAQLIQRRGS